MTEWQDISTAPRDGTRVVLFFPRVFGNIRTGNWKEEYRHIGDNVVYDASGWWADGFDHPFNQEPWTPTHWMPLPEPPDHKD